MKTALVTGASGGIGSAIAEKLADNGWLVAVHYHKNKEKADALVKKLNEKYPGCAAAFCADIKSEEEIIKMVGDVKKSLGRINLLVNNAGIAKRILFTDITAEEWDNMFSVDVRGAFLLSKAVLPDMIHFKEGNIINISSMWGEVGAACEVHYSACKAAIIGFTKALAKEVGPSGIRVNCVSPGVIDTPMNSGLSDEDMEYLKEDTPLMRIGTPEDVANAVLFLAEQSSSFITGQNISCNGGFII